MILKLNEDRFYKLRMGCSHGTDTKDELLGLCGLLQFAILSGIISLQVYGDS